MYVKRVWQKPGLTRRPLPKSRPAGGCWKKISTSNSGKIRMQLKADAVWSARLPGVTLWNKHTQRRRHQLTWLVEVKSRPASGIPRNMVSPSSWREQKARETMSTNWKIKHGKQRAASLQWDGGNRLTDRQSEPLSVCTSSDTEGPLVVRVCVEKGSFYKIGFIFFQTNLTDEQNPTKESKAVHRVLNELYV